MLRGNMAALAFAGLAACTSLPPMPPLPAGRELTITLADRRPPSEVRVEVTASSNANAADGAGIAASGAVGAGAGLAASGACGLLVFICAPVFMIAGGAVGGVGVAAVADAARPPSDDSTIAPLKRLEQRLAAHSQANPMDEQLRLVVVDKASAHWKVVPASTRNSMAVQLAGFALRAESAERISLEIRAMIFVTREDVEHAPTTSSAWPQSGDGPKPGYPRVVFSGSFWYESAAADIEQWMDDSGDFLNTAVARAYEAIAQQIVTALAGRTGPT